jgi:hypothetical protein
MQQMSKVILFFPRRKICRSSEASAQIRRVKKKDTLLTSCIQKFFGARKFK